MSSTFQEAFRTAFSKVGKAEEQERQLKSLREKYLGTNRQTVEQIRLICEQYGGHIYATDIWHIKDKKTQEALGIHDIIFEPDSSRKPPFCQNVWFLVRKEGTENAKWDPNNIIEYRHGVLSEDGYLQMDSSDPLGFPVEELAQKKYEKQREQLKRINLHALGAYFNICVQRARAAERKKNKETLQNKPVQVPGKSNTVFSQKNEIIFSQKTKTLAEVLSGKEKKQGASHSQTDTWKHDEHWREFSAGVENVEAALTINPASGEQRAGCYFVPMDAADRLKKIDTGLDDQISVKMDIADRIREEFELRRKDYLKENKLKKLSIEDAQRIQREIWEKMQ